MDTTIHQRRPFVSLLLATALLLPALADADDRLRLLIQPLPRDERTVRSYQPLAQYIEALTGRSCTIQIPPNFPAYWDVLRRNDYDIAFDGPHFTDYRTNKLGFNPLVKAPDNASYSLIARESERVSDPMQLVGRRIASLGMLSTASTRLSAMFPNPARQPVLIDVKNAEEGIAWLIDRRVEAAFLPTTIVSQRMVRGGGMTVVLTTEPMTRMILSASPRLSSDMQERIRGGLLNAHESDSGRAMLRSVGIERFEAVTPDSFANQRNVLKSYWGY